MIQTTRPHCTAVALTFQALLSVHDGRFGKTAVGIQCIGKLGTSKLISANSDIEHTNIWNVKDKIAPHKSALISLHEAALYTRTGTSHNRDSNFTATEPL